MRHDLQTRDNRILKPRKIFRQRHGHQQAIHAVADAQLSFLWLKMNIGRAVFNRLRNHFGDEANHRSIFVDIGVLIEIGQREFALISIFQTTRSHPEIIADQLLHFIRCRQMPTNLARAKRAHPIEHFIIGQPRGRQMQFVLRRTFDLEGHDLVFTR